MPHIAWIEDDANVIEDVIRPLQKTGFTIAKYTTISEATANMAAIRNADLILLDVIVPPGQSNDQATRYSGVALLKLLKEQPCPPVVALTVIRDPGIHAELKELGVARILTKAVMPSVLKTAVESVLAAATTESR